MPSLLSAAMAEAYASAPRNRIIWETVELRHPTFAVPVRLVRGRETPLTATLEAGAPVNGGQAVTFTPMPFEFTPPGEDDNGPTPAQARIDGVLGELIALLDQTLTDNRAVDVTYRSFRDDQTSAPGQVINGLILDDVTVTALAVEGSLRFRELATQAFPLQTYDRTRFPAAHLL